MNKRAIRENSSRDERRGKYRNIEWGGGERKENTREAKSGSARI